MSRAPARCSSSSTRWRRATTCRTSTPMSTCPTRCWQPSTTSSCSMADRRYIVTFGCPDRTGIVAGIAGFLAAAGGWIVEAAYHTDRESGWFFTRQEVLAESLPFDVDELRDQFAEVARELGAQADWRISDTAQRRRMVILVSREGHCLYDLLGR